MMAKLPPERLAAALKANLKRRKKELLDFIRHGLFADPNFPLP